MTFKVMSKQCDQCLFSKNKIVSDARMRQVLKECARTDTHFVCHKSSMVKGTACCRGFYDRDPDASNLMRIAGKLGAVEFVKEPKK